MAASQPGFLRRLLRGRPSSSQPSRKADSIFGDKDLVDWYRKEVAETDRILARRGREERETSEQLRHMAQVEREAVRRDRAQFVSKYARPATPADYAAWLAGYLATGAFATVDYDHTMPTGDWFVLTARPLTPLPILHGALSISLIVPADVNFALTDVPRSHNGRCGHSSVYFMDGFTKDALTVPVYSDVAALLPK